MRTVISSSHAKSEQLGGWIPRFVRVRRAPHHHHIDDEQAELLGQIAVELVRVRPEIRRRGCAQIIIAALTGGDYAPEHLSRVLAAMRATRLGQGPFGKRLVAVAAHRGCFEQL